MDLVGLLEQSKLFLIESVLPLDKLCKPEFLVKIFYLVVPDSYPVVLDVMEDTPKLPGITSKIQELSLEIYMNKTNTANHTVSLLAITMSKDNTPPVKENPKPPNAVNNATPNTKDPVTKATYILEQTYTHYPKMNSK